MSRILIILLLSVLALPKAYGIDTLSLKGQKDSVGVPKSMLREYSLSAERLEQLLEPTGLKARGAVLGVEFWLQNPTTQDLTYWLYLPYNDFWIVETQPNEKRYYGGHKVGTNHNDFFYHLPFLEITLPAQSTMQFKAVTGSSIGRQSANYPIYLLKPAYFLKQQTQDIHAGKIDLLIIFFFFGALVIMMLYMGILYFQNQYEKMYLYYALYMLFTLVYMLPKVPVFFEYTSFLTNNHQLFSYTNEPSQMALFIFYYLFGAQFLSLKERAPRLYRAFIGVCALYLFYLIFCVIYYSLTGEVTLTDRLFVPTHLGAFLLGQILLIWVWVSYKHPLKYYIITGSLCFTLGSMLAMYFSVNTQEEWLPIAPLNYMKLGIMVELLFFSLGIGRKIRSVAVERDRVQKAYISELKRNEQLSKQTQKELEALVKARTQEILSANEQLEGERAAKLKAQYEQDIIKSQLNSLRLQMNPHFIFNSLNSIRHLILKKDFAQASAYVTDFAKLLRLILQNSKQAQVPLADDLEALQLYLDFEQRRFEENFHYSIQVDPSVDTHGVHIQPLIIQPFVENAIWHGLMHKEGHRQLNITLNTEGDYLRITVVDNGVGRAASKKQHEKRHRHKSFGMAITKSRLELMNRIKKGDGSFVIEDLTHADGSAAGTQVVIKIKL